MNAGVITLELSGEGGQVIGTAVIGPVLYRVELTLDACSSGSDVGQGRVAQLQIRSHDVVLALYDHGWQVCPADDDVRGIVAEILKRYEVWA